MNLNTYRSEQQKNRHELIMIITIEQFLYGDKIAKGFASIEEFVDLANTVLNRRKSRAGKSLEHHLAALFDENGLQYTPQAITEGNKRPDFIFPSQEAYANPYFLFVCHGHTNVFY